MSKDIKEFPELSNKLTAPIKRSLYERQRTEAAEKRAREEADTAAAYEAFVKEYGEDDDNDDMLSRMGGGRAGSQINRGSRGGFGAAPKRHFTPTGPRGMTSGPGSLGPAPSSLQNRKRQFEGAFPGQKDGPRERSTIGFDDDGSAGARGQAGGRSTLLDDEDMRDAEARAEEREVPKPTVQLSNLPPGTSVPAITALLSLNLTVDSVRVLPPSGPGSTEQRSMSSIVTLAKDTPASDIDAAVKALQNCYLGYGFYLNISRHLSSTALGSGIGAPATNLLNSSLPFGAKPIPLANTGPMNRASPPASLRGNFAPPAFYDQTQGQFNGPAELQSSVHVMVTPPADIKQLRLIHQTIEQVAERGPEFEALLMARSIVQKDDAWAWLWDPRSSGGVYYRWRLWHIMHESNEKEIGPIDVPFDDGAPWLAPSREEGLRFEFVTRFDEFVSDADYDSSDEDDSDDEVKTRKQQGRHGDPPEASNMQDSETKNLSPLHKAKLTHLLARLPTTLGKLRRGDVARVTAFAISHSGSGAEETVDMIVSNVDRPLSWSSANPDRKALGAGDEDEEGRVEGESAEAERERKQESEDQGPSKLIGLYLISDILSSSSMAGVRHAWRYRPLFETALRGRSIFETLGRLDKDLGWGRMRAEKWKRSVNGVLGLWEAWCVFPEPAQTKFVEMVNNPPMTAMEKAAEQGKLKALEKMEKSSKSKWRTLDADTESTAAAPHADVIMGEDSVALRGDGKPVDGQPIEDDLDGKPLADDDGLDGKPMDEDALGGQPPGEGALDGKPMPDSDKDVNMFGGPADLGKKEHQAHRAPVAVGPADGLNRAARARLQRLTAADLF